MAQLLADMKQETSQEQWERLQREYQKGIAESYPNPQRSGCPGQEMIDSLAARSAGFEDLEEDVNWKHVVRCGPCYGEYLEMRRAHRAGETLGVHRESA